MFNTSTVAEKNETKSYGTYENEKNKKYNYLRLNANPDISIENPNFDFDGLQDETKKCCENCDLEFNNFTVLKSAEDDTLCEACLPLVTPRATRCRCDDSEPDYYLTCCNCGFEEYEYYGYRYKSSAYCNECALEVCGKLIEKPKFAFKSLQLEKEAREDELLSKYSLEECNELRIYAEKHNLTLEEAIDYQTHCHSCGHYVENAIFHGESHQYCRARCFEHCEDYWYECDRGEDCKVCEIWEYRARQDSLTAHDIELSDFEPVLATIDCFKELQVYGQLYECIEDLVDYFDSDRQWRYGYV